MNPSQMAQTALRQIRKAGLTVRVAYPAEGEPTLHVGPKERLRGLPWLRGALAATKREVIALLEAEGHGHLTAADGTVWHQALARCEKCGACDWVVIATTEIRGEQANRWGCGTCRASPEALQTQLEQTVLGTPLAPQEDTPHA